MSNQFLYSVLTYQHSLFLGEVVNVGVLFIFPDENRVEFQYPKKLNRISSLYADYNEKLLKEYLKGFASVSKKLGKKITAYQFDLEQLIADNLLVPDASALQFSKFRGGIYYETSDKVISTYFNLLLGDYNVESTNDSIKISDHDIILKLQNKLEEIIPEKKNLIKFDNRRILQSSRVKFSSDFFWKNGHINYAKAVSFDLASETHIINKALLLNGHLQQLEKDQGKKHIDFIVYKSENLKFSEAIEEAVSYLNNNDNEKRFYENWDSYCLEIAENITDMD